MPTDETANATQAKRNNRQGLIIFGVIVGVLIAIALVVVIVKPTGNSAMSKPISKESDFLDRTVADFPNVSESDLIALGHLECDAFAAGAPGWQVHGMMLGKGLSISQVVALTSAAVIDFCPQYKDLALQN